MNNPEKILHGFLELSVSGDQLERFLNLCHARAVSLYYSILSVRKKDNNSHFHK